MQILCVCKRLWTVDAEHKYRIFSITSSNKVCFKKKKKNYIIRNLQRFHRLNKTVSKPSGVRLHIINFWIKDLYIHTYVRVSTYILCRTCLVDFIFKFKIFSWIFSTNNAIHLDILYKSIQNNNNQMGFTSPLTVNLKHCISFHSPLFKALKFLSRSLRLPNSSSNINAEWLISKFLSKDVISMC